MSRNLSLFAVLMLNACASLTSPDAIDSQALASSELHNLPLCQSQAILDLLHAPTTNVETLQAIDVHTRAAKHLVAHRDGPDAIAGTPDDVAFASLEEVDAVPWVGPVAMDALLSWGLDACEGLVEVPTAPDPCLEESAVSWVNEASAEEMVDGGVHRRAAESLVETRQGPDGLDGTDDDVVFTSLDQIDAVPWVGPAAMEALEAWAEQRCSAGFAEAVFSPRPYHDSHLTRVIELLDTATDTLDIAMYSMSDATTREAVIRAHQRGVSVRILFHGAAKDRKSPAGSRSAQFEEAGIEVRWVNKIMHHKFALVDGPRTDWSRAKTATLMTGSGNWSHGAATRFDENTVIITADERLNLAYQQEFELLWAHSREFTWNESIAHIPASPIPDEAVESAQGSSVLFTSANFRTYTSSRYGETFARDGDRSLVVDGVVAAIDDAEHSVKVAHGHMRFRPLAAALMRAHDRGVDVQVYLDGQEYTSFWTFDDQNDEYQACLAAAQDDGDETDCNQQGMHFGWALQDHGISLRYKYYAFRWDYTYADQMHHKYIVLDERSVLTGSWNASPNAEWDTFENLAIFEHNMYPELVESFVDNFDQIFETEREQNTYEEMLDEVRYGTGDFPIVFSPMALDWQEVYTLKSAIAEACPEVYSDAYRENPGAHRWCNR